MKIQILKFLSVVNIFFLNLYNTFISIIKIIIFSKKLIQTKLINSFNLSKNNKCIIIMNGPNLISDLGNNSWIYNEKNIFCVNNFSTTDLYQKLKPNFYMISDPAYWEKNPGDFLLDYRKKIYQSIINKTNWSLDFFIPHESFNNLNKMEIFNNKNINPILFNQTAIKGLKIFRELCYKIGLGTPTPNNVLIPALIKMINLGFKEIFILGTDHSMFKNVSVGEDNILYKDGEHFYGKGKRRKLYSYKYINGFVNDSVSLRMSEFLMSAAILFESHELINDFAKSNNVSITNLTKNSFIDSYEK